MKTFCEKCGKINSPWKSGVKFEGLDEHHNPPEFMFNEGEKWTGEMLTLCRECHTGKKGIHQKIIIPFLNNFVGNLKANGNEHWLWIKVIPCDRMFCRELCYELTKKWLGEKDGNTETTTTEGN